MPWRVLCFACLLLTTAQAVPSLVQPLNDAVTMVYDDAGNWGGNNWGGDMSTNITHQNAPGYQARKILDLSDVTPALWARTRAVRLSLFFMVHDYSFALLPQTNGLDEAFRVTVNGRVHEYADNCGAPVLPQSGAPPIDWYDLELPKDEFHLGPNTLVIGKAPGKVGKPDAQPDDYLYLGIDTSRKRGNSAVTFDGTTWTDDKLTVPGGNGEYMVRLYLLTGEPTVRAAWRPGRAPERDDPGKLLLYAGAHGAETTPTGVHLRTGQAARLEWDAGAFDRLAPLRLSAVAAGPVQLAWLDASGRTEGTPKINGLAAEQAAGRAFRPAGLVLTATGDATVASVTLEGAPGLHPTPAPLDMAPPIADPPRGTPAKPAARMTKDAVTLTGGYTEAVFARGEHLGLRSLRNRLTGTELLRHPDEVALFLVEVGEQRYAGSRDFRLVGLTPRGQGFAAVLEGPAGAPNGLHLRATLRASADTEGVRLAMELANAGAAPVDFKLAFPHLAGVAVSEQPADDCYFYPFGGGIFAGVPAVIRHGYGDYEALYQVMDVYSPARGCGLSVRLDDSEGWHKVLVLRKHVPERPSVNERRSAVDSFVRPEYRWTNSLDTPVEGTSFACEYLRRTRAPLSQAAAPVPGDAASWQKTATFTPAPAVLAVHPGDWHEALRRYAEWAHHVWRWRPYPTALQRVKNMMSAGWGQAILFKDGQYRTDTIKPGVDCIELMSWWDWSPLGPFNTPLDQLDKVLTPQKIAALQPYLVKDPVTGKLMWNNQPGDYRGYNERFGGLPAFRQAIETYRKMGAMVTLYTDPLRLDGNNEVGREHGEAWCVVGVDGKKHTGYEVWNPCHGLAEVRAWTAETMGRVMRETGADGIRLDEYGHRGWACYDPTHRHTWQEPGITQWLKALTEEVRQVHARMDEARPGSILTTEFPGYDYLMPAIDGCITYDLSVLQSPLRPLEVNNQRFFFPECQAYELDLGPDPTCRRRFWNAVNSFDKVYPGPMDHVLRENADAYQGRAVTPLVPTLQPRLYANRFRAGAKTLIHLYNAVGHTFDGPALALPAGRDLHAVELLRGTELPVRDGRVSLYLERDDVACVAILPRRLTLDPAGQVRLRDEQGGRLVLAGADGAPLWTKDVSGAGSVAVTGLAADARPVVLKLLRGGQMVDTVPWPATAGR